MASIFDTVWGTGPQRARRQANGPSARVAPGGDAKRRKRLTEIESFGADPGALRMLAYAPANLAPGAALVVVLHGCTQSAEDYDAQSGWSALADELGFALLYPEQRRANNPAGCFNWFLAADSARGLGEARSIREMVETMIALRGLDRGRIYVTGLSAGGAMAANLLAGYPDVFSAGALIAGLPCGAAANVTEAFGAMSQPAARTDAELGDAVRPARPMRGRGRACRSGRGSPTAPSRPATPTSSPASGSTCTGRPPRRPRRPAAAGGCAAPGSSTGARWSRSTPSRISATARRWTAAAANARVRS
ncbi:extracellular catalytic domain type 1 short-chain-length polyhydroxyalkanoate depolymerase [Chenggangzhangella methanolivorans]|uniref:PHB depolymerase family esterase n=1 Tax=Chenggangzhangella methanolivorans TaxID=1437009 RepID=A0A9E6RCU9_9HYPH|nr:PHB depolymerase family esterase [Chenggangzhangella methanolivorans]QZN98685.1 PHB depolymerase family esterase [Chenggangzhangella methanolivorans]